MAQFYRLDAFPVHQTDSVKAVTAQNYPVTATGQFLSGTLLKRI